MLHDGPAYEASEAEAAYERAFQSTALLQRLSEIANPEIVRTIWLLAYVRGRMDGIDQSVQIRQ